MSSTSRRTSSTRRMRAIRPLPSPTGGRPSACSPATASTPPFVPPLEEIAEQERDAPDQEPGELGVHVILAESVDEERDAERQHAGHLQDPAREAAHRAPTIAPTASAGHHGCAPLLHPLA